MALTGVVASLAACPTRSMEGWLVGMRASAADGPFEKMIDDILASGGSQDADERSIDERLDSLARVRLVRKGRREIDPEDDDGVPAILDITVNWRSRSVSSAPKSRASTASSSSHQSSRPHGANSD